MYNPHIQPANELYAASVAPEEVTSAKQQFASIIDEFFSSEEVNEVKKSLQEMNVPVRRIQHISV